MWIDSDRYKHKGVFEELARRLRQDYDELKQSGHDPIKQACQILKFEFPEVYPELQFANDSPEYHHPDNWEDRENPREVWYGEGVYLDGKINERYKNHWKHSAEYVQQGNIPGLLQMMVNFIKPGGILPIHDDRGGWERIDRWTGERQRGFTVSVGIDIPSSDPRLCGLEFDKDKRGQENGGWLVFEGRNQKHTCWNLTKQWRVAAVVDVQAKEFDLEGFQERLNSIWEKEDKTIYGE
jgi:hypothetical protein